MFFRCSSQLLATFRAAVRRVPKPHGRMASDAHPMFVFCWTCPTPPCFGVDAAPAQSPVSVSIVMICQATIGADRACPAAKWARLALKPPLGPLRAHAGLLNGLLHQLPQEAVSCSMPLGPVAHGRLGGYDAMCLGHVCHVCTGTLSSLLISFLTRMEFQRPQHPHMLATSPHLTPYWLHPLRFSGSHTDTYKPSAVQRRTHSR